MVALDCGDPGNVRTSGQGVQLSSMVEGVPSRHRLDTLNEEFTTVADQPLQFFVAAHFPLAWPCRSLLPDTKAPSLSRGCRVPSTHFVFCQHCGGARDIRALPDTYTRKSV